MKRFIGDGAMSVLLIDLKLEINDRNLEVNKLRDKLSPAKFPLHVRLLLKVMDYGKLVLYVIIIT